MDIFVCMFFRKNVYNQIKPYIALHCAARARAVKRRDSPKIQIAVPQRGRVASTLMMNTPVDRGTRSTSYRATVVRPVLSIVQLYAGRKPWTASRGGIAVISGHIRGHIFDWSI